jgi:hypothetical protein
MKRPVEYRLRLLSWVFALLTLCGCNDAPNVTVTIEPQESGEVVFLPVAANTANEPPTAKLCLLLFIQNNEATNLHLNKVGVTFIGQPSVPEVSIQANLDIASSTTQSWHFMKDDCVILPVPTPSNLRLDLFFDGFDDPANEFKALKPHQSPTQEGSYLFPARATDLRVGEYWKGKNIHGAGNQGSQLFGYDMDVVGFDFKTLVCSHLLPGTNGDKNTDFRIWGKPIYAMADGTVRHFENEVPGNPHPLKWTSPNDLKAKLQQQKNSYWGSFTFGGSGNHFYIQHGDEIALYAHLQQGSLPNKLLNVGATVQAGEYLGLAGNTGNSTAPHLHIHTVKGTTPETGSLRPLLFHGIYLIDRSVLNPPDPAGPWVKAVNKGLLSVETAIWPAPTAPAWYPPGWAELSKHGIPESKYQDEYNKIVQSGYRLVWIDGYDVNGKTYFNVIFRAEDGTPWNARHGLTSSEYQAEFDQQKEAGFRPLQVESYISNNHIRYATIFVKAPGPAWTAYHWKSANEHQQLFDNFKEEGWRPVVISVEAPNGSQRYTTLYEMKDIGSYFTKSNITASQYQNFFNSNDEAGRKLVYLNAFNNQGSPRFTAIWQTKTSYNPYARHGMTGAEYQNELDNAVKKGMLTRAVTGYESGNQATFAALWSK